MSNSRKSLWVDPELQKRIIWTFMFIGLSMVFVNMLIFSIFLRQMIRYVGESSTNPELYSFLQSLGVAMGIVTVVVSLALLIGFSLYGVIFSNRIAGPIYRVNNAIEEILSGKKNVVFNVRKDDYFQSLAQQVQKLIAKYESRDQSP